MWCFAGERRIGASMWRTALSGKKRAPEHRRRSARGYAAVRGLTALPEEVIDSFDYFDSVDSFGVVGRIETIE